MLVLRRRFEDAGVCGGIVIDSRNAILPWKTR